MNEFKEFINQILDVPKLIVRIWITLWICLIILLIMKFCFEIWYPIVIENETLIMIFDDIDTTFLKYVIPILFYIPNMLIVYLTACRKTNFSKASEFIIINTLVILTYIVKCFNNYLAFIGEFLIVIPIPIFYLLKYHPEHSKIKDILWTFILQGLIMLWQCNILLVRGLPNPPTSVGTIIQIVLQFDYYIFLSVLWIGVSHMGLFGIWFFVNDVTKLKSIKEKELAKAHPNMETIKNIDAKISKLEAGK